MGLFPGLLLSLPVSIFMPPAPVASINFAVNRIETFLHQKFTYLRPTND